MESVVDILEDVFFSWTCTQWDICIVALVVFISQGHRLQIF